MTLGIARARRLGCAVVALGNAHHLGRIGAWAEMAVAEDGCRGLLGFYSSTPAYRPVFECEGYGEIQPVAARRAFMIALQQPFQPAQHRQFQAPQDIFTDWRHARSPGSGAAPNG